MELFQARRNKSAPVQEWDYDDMMELACSEKMEPYGLQLRENKPTQVFSKDKRISRANGNWMIPFLKNVCGELIGEYDEQIIKLTNYDTFVDDVCHSIAGLCEKNQELLDSIHKLEL
eukprot:TRINITY_DN148_c0_g2_i1.p1 TRINITY_DN148_c0_g2~~TRINITY_DN148_c0_g2_i1.p1  ORF type:complete len:117 (+),score=32.42 TRINITY_DN148_c0_g2_i1:449-799(+)